MREDLKVLEALLFIENNTVDVKRLMSVLKSSKENVEKLIDELSAQYTKEGHCFYIQRVADSYELTLDDEFAKETLSPYLVKKKKLPKGLMETLMIIAYKQPITRVEIETIRGVNTTSYIKQLHSEGFIDEVGRKDTVGNPVLYGTTLKFLTHFSMESLKDLPPLSEIKQYDFLD